MLPRTFNRRVSTAEIWELRGLRAPLVDCNKRDTNKTTTFFLTGSPNKKLLYGLKRDTNRKPLLLFLQGVPEQEKHPCLSPAAGIFFWGPKKLRSGFQRTVPKRVPRGVAVGTTTSSSFHPSEGLSSLFFGVGWGTRVRVVSEFATNPGA